jgi:hypothetical protein
MKILKKTQQSEYFERTNASLFQHETDILYPRKVPKKKQQQKQTRKLNVKRTKKSKKKPKT